MTNSALNFTIRSAQNNSKHKSGIETQASVRDFDSVDIKSSYASEMKRKIDYLRGKKSS